MLFNSAFVEGLQDEFERQVNENNYNYAEKLSWAIPKDIKKKPT